MEAHYFHTLEEVAEEFGVAFQPPEGRVGGLPLSGGGVASSKAVVVPPADGVAAVDQAGLLGQLLFCGTHARPTGGDPDLTTSGDHQVTQPAIRT